MKKKKNKSNILIVLISLLICVLMLILGMYLGGNFERNNSLNNKCKEENNIPKLENTKNILVVDDTVVYEVVLEAKEDAPSEKYNEYLVLYTDGTFRRDNASETGDTEYGNYMIKDNKLYLNYLTHTGSDVGIHYSDRDNSILLINEDGTITDNNYKNTFITSSSITFNKVSDTSNLDSIKNENLKEILKKSIKESSYLINSNI